MASYPEATFGEMLPKAERHPLRLGLHMPLSSPQFPDFSEM
jgi:hypothetical protein